MHSKLITALNGHVLQKILPQCIVGRGDVTQPGENQFTTRQGNAPGKSKNGKTFVRLDKPYNFSKGYYRTSKPRFTTKQPNTNAASPLHKVSLNGWRIFLFEKYDVICFHFELQKRERISPDFGCNHNSLSLTPKTKLRKPLQPTLSTGHIRHNY